mmetsp:Transcript_15098/g.36805  ORF Transcript_15098/g.36805 Transcript_15098/m.36805 type:complete len:213 (+) Transcript_15098:480-1118(+)
MRGTPIVRACPTWRPSQWPRSLRQPHRTARTPGACRRWARISGSGSCTLRLLAGKCRAPSSSLRAQYLACSFSHALAPRRSHTYSRAICLPQSQRQAHSELRRYILLGAKAFEAALESAPQAYIQLYALLFLGLDAAGLVPKISLALSLAIIAQGALWLMTTDRFRNDLASQHYSTNVAGCWRGRVLRRTSCAAGSPSACLLSRSTRASCQH